MPDIQWSDVTEWLLSHGVRILLVAAIAYVVYFIVHKALPRGIEATISRVEEQRAEAEVQKRVHTLSVVANWTVRAVLISVAGFMILSELGVNIAPVLTGVGVIGLAVGFGAQNLVRDVISGLFILIENHYGKGDVVNLAGIGGLVEDINLRRTVLRDLDGIVHNIPNGEIKVSSNYTRDWSRVNMNVGVSYGEDLDHVISVINRVGQEIADDPEFGPLIIGTPKVLRVDNFGDSSIDIKILGETQPIRQWDVMGELRKRLKKAFDEEGIEIPFPHRTVVWAGAKATKAQEGMGSTPSAGQ